MLPLIGIMLAVLSLTLVASATLKNDASRKAAVIGSGIVFVLSFILLATVLSTGSFGASEQIASYLPQLNVLLEFKVTAISLVLIVMASIVAFVTLLSGNVEMEHLRVSSSLVVLFELAAIGLFASGNLLMFFIFWDVGVVALFFMIYLLGSANRRHAAMKFLIYELMASLLLLLGIMMIYFYTPLHSFNIAYITSAAHTVTQSAQSLIFIVLFAAFLINMPVFPVHLWLPDAHTEASTQGSMLLSGILTKFGGYGMLILFSMLPIASSYMVPVMVLAAFSAFYSVLVLMVQHDMKRIVAYTTIVEMSIILVGIASLSAFGTAGATYAMLAHGLTVALMFLAAGSVGYMFADRDIRSVSGIVRNALSTTYAFLLGIFATTGVPLTTAFIGDVLIFIGAIGAFGMYGAVPLGALVLLGTFLYYVINKSFMSVKDRSNPVAYIGKAQNAGYAILLFFILLFGILPFVMLKLFGI
jgi:NADH-quinone oxidoreductase subunit M